MSTKSELIAKAVLAVYDSFPITAKPCSHKLSSSTSSSSNHSHSREYTVLAGIVMERCHDDSYSSFQVISIGTGTKCLPQKEVSSFGDNLADCHAEVLARRAFIRFLYLTSLRLRASLLAGKEEENNPLCPLQLTATATATTNATAMKANSPYSVTLKSGFKFHLYVSDPPCGDASIYCRRTTKPLLSSSFSSSSYSSASQASSAFMNTEYAGSSFTGAKRVTCSGDVLKEEGRQALGVMRLKSGRSDIPSDERSTSLSCSDKILRWYCA